MHRVILVKVVFDNYIGNVDLCDAVEMHWWYSWMFCFYSSSGAVLQPWNWWHWSAGWHCH